MRYVMFVIDDGRGPGTSAEMEAILAFNGELRAAGHWVLAAGIGGPSMATLVDDRDGAGSLVAGSITPGDEHVSGFWIVEVPDHERARELAARGSRACGRRVELRPFLD